MTISPRKISRIQYLPTGGYFYMSTLRTHLGKIIVVGFLIIFVIAFLSRVDQTSQRVADDIATRRAIETQVHQSSP